MSAAVLLRRASDQGVMITLDAGASAFAGVSAAAPDTGRRDQGEP